MDEERDPPLAGQDGADDTEALQAQSAFSRQVVGELEGIGPVLVAGLVPLALCLMLLGFVIDLPGWAYPVIVVTCFFAIPLLHVYRRHAHSALPLIVPGKGIYTGARKKRALALALLGALALLVSLTIVDDIGGFLLMKLRDWLLDWRI